MIIYDNFNIMSLLTLITIFMIAFLLVSNNDKIDIDFHNSFEEEYKQCSLDLENTQPICPACQCSSPSTFWDSLWAFIIGMVLMFFIYDYLIFPKIMKARLATYSKSNTHQEKKK